MKLHSLSDLLEIMAALRDPEKGCPWDKQQSYSSIAPSTLEECYELVDAIEQGDFSDFKEELGDLLFQVVFYAQLAKEDEQFEFDEVVSVLAEKLLRRHPHVFPDGTLASFGVASSENAASIASVKQNWEMIKSQERKVKQKNGVLADIPQALPAMIRAEKIQKRASRVGFDWPDSEGVWKKLHEEIDELQQACASDDHQAMTEELGDVLFSCINLARHLNIEPESALRATNRKFEQRFNFVEKSVVDKGGVLTEQSLQELESLWLQAKEKALAEAD